MPTVREQLEGKYGKPAVNPVSTPVRTPSQGSVRAALTAKYKPVPVEKTFGQKALGVGKTVKDFIFSSEKALGEHMGNVLAAPGNVNRFEKSVDDFQAQSTKMMDAIDKAKAEGKDTKRMVAAFKLYNQNAPNSEDFVSPEMQKQLEKGFWQTAGEVGGVSLDILSAGTYGKVKAGTGILGTTKYAKNVITPSATKLSAFGKGALSASKEAVPMGFGFGVTSAMQEDKSLGETLVSGTIGAITSGILSSVMGGFANRKNITPSKLKEEAVNQYKKGLMLTKEKYKERADKLIPQLLEDKTWGSKKKLLDKASKGIDLSNKSYEQLGELQGIADTDGILKNIDDEITKYSQGGRAAVEKMKIINNEVSNQLLSAKQIIADADMAEQVAKSGGLPAVISNARRNIVDGLRKGYGLNDVADAIENNIDMNKMNSIDEYQRAIQSIVDDFKPKPLSVNVERINALKGLRNDISSLQIYNKTTPQAYQQDIRELAATYGKDVYDSRKAQKTINDSKVLSQVKKVDASLRDLLAKKNPEYADINKIYHTNSELFDIIEEAKKNELGSVFGKLKQYLSTIGWGAAGSVVGASTGGMAILPIATAGLTTAGFASLMKSTWWNSLRAVQKNNLANELASMGGKELSDLMIQVYRQGPRILSKFTNTKKEEKE